MVFQNYALYPHLTLFENIAFPLRIRHMPRSEVKQRVEWAASLVQIQHLLSRKPRQTSGGERQRTALARSLVRNPEVFLFDEPLSNLDSKLRHSARDELREFHKKADVTAIYVTHDQVEAMGLGDRIVVMNAGEFGRLERRERSIPGRLIASSRLFSVAPPMNLVPYDGSLFGFRPEILAPEDGQSGGSKGFAIDVSVQRVEYLGNDILLYGTGRGLDPANRLISRFPSLVPSASSPASSCPSSCEPRICIASDSASGKATPLNGVPAMANRDIGAGRQDRRGDNHGAERACCSSWACRSHRHFHEPPEHRHRDERWDFVGLRNFIWVFKSQEFYETLGRTAIWVFGSASLEMIIGTSFAC